MRVGFGLGFSEAVGQPAAVPDETAPVITSSNTASIAENTVLAHSLTANESVTWSIIGGADQALFELSGSTLRWASNGTQDYEDPADADTDNDYVVQVRATDAATNTADQTITVTVTDQDEIPTAFSFTDITDATLSTEYTSNTITVAGLGSGVSVPVSITGGTYSKNGAGYTSSAGTAVNGDQFSVRHTSSGSNSTATDTALTIGGGSDTYTTTTVAGESYGANLNPDEPFDSAGSWTRYNYDSGGTSGISVTGGKAVFTTSGGDQRFLYIGVGSQAAGEYRFTIDIDAQTLGGSNKGRLSNAGSFGGTTVVVTTDFSGLSGTVQFTVNAPGSFDSVGLDIGGSGTFDNLKLEKRL